MLLRIKPGPQLNTFRRTLSASGGTCVTTHHIAAASRFATRASLACRAMKLYDFSLAYNPGKARLVLVEKGLPFETVNVNLLNGESLNPQFLKINPAGTLPVLEDEGQTITESRCVSHLPDVARRITTCSSQRHSTCGTGTPPHRTVFRWRLQHVLRSRGISRALERRTQ
jgi:hypothetical protein